MNTTFTFQCNITVTFQCNTTVTFQYNTTVTFQCKTTVTLQYNTTVTFQCNTTVTFKSNTTIIFQCNTTFTFQCNTTDTFQYNTTVTFHRNATVTFQRITTVTFQYNTTVTFQCNSTVTSCELVSSIRYKLTCAYREDSNRPVHQLSLIRVVVFRLKKCFGLLATHIAHIEDSDQTARMRRLISVADGRTCQLVLLLVTLLSYLIKVFYLPRQRVESTCYES